MIAAISRAARIEPVDITGVRADKLAALLAATGATPAVAEFIAELLGCHRGVASARLRAARDNPSLMFDGIRDAWLSWLAGLCERQPQLIVIEDLHWVDGPSVALLDAALARLAERPLMVVALARPDIHDRTPGPVAERRPHLRRLDPLPRRAVSGWCATRSAPRPPTSASRRSSRARMATRCSSKSWCARRWGRMARPCRSA